MKILKCVPHFFNYQRVNLKKNTIRNYEFVLGNFQEQFGEAELSSITPEDVLDFMTKLTGGKKQSTKNCVSPFFPPFSIS